MAGRRTICNVPERRGGLQEHPCGQRGHRVQCFTPQPPTRNRPDRATHRADRAAACSHQWGYTPHVHFGMEIARLQIDGHDAVVSRAALGEEEIEVRLPEGAPPRVHLQIHDRTFDITTSDGVSRGASRSTAGFDRGP